MEETGVTRRTVYRDLKEVEGAGYPLISERQDDGTVIYSFISGYSKLPPITFSLEELMTLYLSRDQLGFLQGTPFHDDLEGIFGRIRSAMPPRSVAHLERLSQATTPRFQGYKNYSSQYDLLKDLRTALLRQHQIEMKYQPVGKKVTSYLADPYTVIFFNNALYLGCYAHNRGALRLFAVSRIKSVKVLEDRFEVPEDFTADEFTGSAFGLIDDGVQQVKLLFDKKAAFYIRERIWHPGQIIEENKDGSLTLQFEAAGDQEILAWVNSFIPHVKVLGPESLLEKFLSRLRQGLEFQNT